MSSLPLSFQKFLNDISNRGIHRGLDRMTEALRLLEQPQKNYRIIHIAGTNGKGSTCQFIAQMLALSGHRVGLTLSPHVDDYRERIQFFDDISRRTNLIPVDDLMRVHEHLQQRIPALLELTYFEWSTLLALEYFKDQKVDFAVLETGMGGRWDATNTCESIVSGITTIGLDHTEYLGSTLPDILNEKLQIIKKGSDFLFGPQEAELVKQAQKHCLEAGACFNSFIGPISRIGHIGPINFLQKNWDFAVQICELLKKRGVAINETALVYGQHIKPPPARLELVRRDPDILVDGAHNPEGLTALKQYADQHYPSGYDVVFGCLNDRSFLDMARLIQSLHNNSWLLFDGGARTTPRNVYEDVQKKLGGSIVSLDDSFLIDVQNTKRPLVVCGSFYVCAQFKEWLSVKREA